MARKIKFALELKGGYQARSNIDEIRNYFDAEKIIAQFCDGRLETWLRDHFQSDLAEKVGKLDKDDPDLLVKLCEILGVEQEQDAGINTQAVIERQDKLQKLSQYTDDKDLLEKADKAAFSQEDLQQLIEDGETEILLCGGPFTIPLAEKNKHYYGVGKSIAVIESETAVDFAALGIRFDNIPFDEGYEKVKVEASQRVTPATEIHTRENDSADILAELLGVLVYGKLKGGQELWESHCEENEYIDYAPWKGGGVKRHLDNRNCFCDALSTWCSGNSGESRVIGAIGWQIYYSNTHCDKRLFFTDDGFTYSSGYFLRTRSESDKAYYKDITDVSYISTSTSVGLKIYSGDKQIDFPSDAYLAGKVNLTDLRLFLLIAAKMLGKCEYEFTNEEVNRLRLVRLEALDGGCILDYLLGKKIAGEPVVSQRSLPQERKTFRKDDAANVLAELLGVFVHGKLKNGRELWQSNSAKDNLIDYVPLQKDDKRLRNYSIGKLPFGRKLMDICPVSTTNSRFSLKYKTIGVAVDGKNSLSECIIFTANGFYHSKDGVFDSVLTWYKKITQVIISDKSFEIVSENGGGYLPSFKIWKERLDLPNIRLFLLIAARLLGDCQYEFTNEEMKRIQLVHLSCLNDDCIVDYL